MYRGYKPPRYIKMHYFLAIFDFMSSDKKRFFVSILKSPLSRKRIPETLEDLEKIFKNDYLKTVELIEKECEIDVKTIEVIYKRVEFQVENNKEKIAEAKANDDIDLKSWYTMQLGLRNAKNDTINLDYDTNNITNETRYIEVVPTKIQ